MSELLSARAFAQLVGVSNVYISKLVKQGVLPLVDGKIPKDEGLVAYEANKKPGYDVLRERSAAVRLANKAKKEAKEKAIPKEDIKIDGGENLSQTNASSFETEAKVNAQYNKARAIEKTYQAQLKEIELKITQGALVEASEVKREAAKLAAMIRQKIMSVAPIIAATSEGKSANQIQRIVEIELNEALTELQKIEV